MSSAREPSTSADAALKPEPVSEASAPERARRHFTAVFEYNVQKYPVNPFLAETPWGRPLAVGIGDSFAEADIYRDALEAIADGEVKWTDVERFAQDALDQATALTKQELAR